MLGDLKHLFTTVEYKYYENSEAMILLKDLYQKTRSYYTNIETASRFSDKNKLLTDLKWIEIQNTSKKTEKILQQFIEDLRKEKSL